ncbi:diguanylate cyclase [Thiohalocapsa marina]|uniref:diguanylate cyclase n=1 Tax=Thiohalocapsa marina TaxID=424902 RepID=A0A5M8FMC4_9GAMM|nr:diguanylate cyclase [Thiohalocapsa marina]KAA6185998.1 diguanylate cyclase [Thiohalocapsa marina]
MSIKVKLILGLCLLLLLLALGVSVVFYRLILPGAEAVERRERVTDLVRVEQAIGQELKRIHQVSREWGNWDDTYRFAATHDPAYVASNVTAHWLQQLEMDLLVILDTDGRVLASVFSALAQPLADGLIADTLAPALAPAAPSTTPVGTGPLLPERGSGLLNSAAGVLLLGAARILPTDGQGPASGTLYFGRLVSDAFAAGLSEQLQLPVQLALGPAPSSAPQVEALSANQSLAQTGLALLNDPQRSLQIRLQQGRPHYKQMLVSVRYQLAAIFLAGLVASLVAYFLLECILVEPILRLAREAERFSRTHRPEAFAFTAGRDEIGQLARAFADMAERVSDGRHLLERERDKLERESLTDPLTGLGNRRYLEQALAADRAADGAGNTGVGSSRAARLVVSIDLDFFKRVNDHHGHDVGDRVLQQMAEILRRCSREQDILARCGGEEFVLVCRGVDENDAMGIVERIRRETAGHPFGDADRQLQLTCSSGFVLFPPWAPDVSPDAGPEASKAESDARLLKLADLALYQAKAEGRNGWVGYGVEPGTAHARLPVTAEALHAAVTTGLVHRISPPGPSSQQAA